MIVRVRFPTCTRLHAREDRIPPRSELRTSRRQVAYWRTRDLGLERAWRPTYVRSALACWVLLVEAHQARRMHMFTVISNSELDTVTGGTDFQAVKTMA